MKRKIVTLCGSTRFKKEFETTERILAMDGVIVLTVGCFGHADNLCSTPEQKRKLDELHKDKILISDEIFVINVGGYIGDSTRSEIEFAEAHGKAIFYWDNNYKLSTPAPAGKERDD